MRRSKRIDSDLWLENYKFILYETIYMMMTQLSQYCEGGLLVCTRKDSTEEEEIYKQDCLSEVCFLTAVPKFQEKLRVLL